MTTTMTTRSSPPATVPARAAAYGAAVWALAFAGVNLYLQAVGIDGLDGDRTAFTVVNLGVVGLKVVGAVVALGTVHGGRRVPPPLISVGAWGAAATLLLYTGYGLVATVATGDLLTWMLAGGTFWMPTLAYLGFFAVGGGLFAVAARQHQRRHGVRGVWALVGALGAPLLLGAVLLGASLVF
jgi:hypothetical protein